MKYILITILFLITNFVYCQNASKPTQPKLDANSSLISIIYDLSTENKFKIAKGVENESAFGEIYYPYNLFGADYTFFSNYTIYDASFAYKTDTNTVGYIKSVFYVNPSNNDQNTAFVNLENTLVNSVVYKKYFGVDNIQTNIHKQIAPLDFNDSKSLTEEQKKQMNAGFKDWFNNYEIILKLNKDSTFVKKTYDDANNLKIYTVTLTAWLQLKSIKYTNELSKIDIRKIQYLQYTNSISNKEVINNINKNIQLDANNKPIKEVVNTTLGAYDWDIVNIKNYFTNNTVLVHNKTECKISNSQMEAAYFINLNLYEAGANTSCFDKNTAGIFLGRSLLKDIMDNNRTNFRDFDLLSKTYDKYYINVNGEVNNIVNDCIKIRIKYTSMTMSGLPYQEFEITFINNPDFSLVLKVEALDYMPDTGYETETLYQLTNVISK